MPTHVSLRRGMMMEQCEMNCARCRGNKRTSRAGSVSVLTTVMRNVLEEILSEQIFIPQTQCRTKAKLSDINDVSYCLIANIYSNFKVKFPTILADVSVFSQCMLTSHACLAINNEWMPELSPRTMSKCHVEHIVGCSIHFTPHRFYVLRKSLPQKLGQ